MFYMRNKRARRNEERRRMAERAWRTYYRDHEPPIGQTANSKKYFMAGYVRGKAMVLGFAIIYCCFLTIMAIIGLLIILRFG